MILSNILNGIKKGLLGDPNRSKSVAKSRLQFVLVQDRAGMSNEEMGHFKIELMSVIEKYFRIEKNKFDITYKREGESTTLLINSPVMFKREENVKNIPLKGKKNSEGNSNGVAAAAAND